jgi:hypothetical protein
MGGVLPEKILRQFILYKAIVALDEADSYAHKQMQNNTTKALGEIFRRRRHTFAAIAMVMINIDEFAPVLLNQITHRVTCYWEGHKPDTCSILIDDVRKGGTGIAKWLWLRPADWTRLWNSHNITAMTHETNVSYSSKSEKKKKEEEQ